jgi:hypothetical protein
MPLISILNFPLLSQIIFNNLKAAYPFKLFPNDIIIFDISNIKFNVKHYNKTHSVFIEEYEFYKIDNTFTMDENPSYYSPRNDVRKRLVFTFKLI